jgi:hypothetical protein
MISKLKKVSPTPEEAIVHYSPGFFKAAALALRGPAQIHSMISGQSLKSITLSVVLTEWSFRIRGIGLFFDRLLHSANLNCGLSLDLNNMLALNHQ